MAVHLHRDLNQLQQEILKLGSMVETATDKAIHAVIDRRPELSDEVNAIDREVDEREIHIEDECLKVLALHQPVANDLRFVVALLKVNNDLERVGDLARNIARRAASLHEHPSVSIPPEILSMSEKVRQMLRDCLNSLLSLDADAARRVLAADDEVDELHSRIFKTVEDQVREQPQDATLQLSLLSVSRYLERIADMATNIAEDVVFIVEGKLIRHEPA